MQLVEIKNNDLRNLQIRRYNSKYEDKIFILSNSGLRLENDKYTIISCFEKAGKRQIIQENIETIRNETHIIGFFGITHKLEDGKLIEIERKEFEIDDVVEFHNMKGNYAVLVRETMGENGCYYFNNVVSITQYRKDNVNEYIRKIGILGVTHEFINNKLNQL